MAEIDHWHPVLSSRALRKKPVAVQLCGEELAIYRTADGSVGALGDACPHRRMRLSLGRVAGDKLTCAYHGWTFTKDGQGESPGSPKLHACAKAYDACEKHGYVWARRAGSTVPFPEFDIEGWTRVGAADFAAEAPLELTVDNFCEIEHTPEVHLVFGYDKDRMPEVEVKTDSTEDTVHMVTLGPAKAVGPVLSFMIGIGKDFHFRDEWTTKFSPVHSVYDHSWVNPKTGQESKVKWRVYVFFTPQNANKTRVTAFTFAKSKWPGPTGGIRPFRWLMRKHLRREIDLDLAILKGLASHEPGVDGMKLGRFDKCLVLNRERINRVYRGSSESYRKPLPVSAE